MEDTSNLKTSTIEFELDDDSGSAHSYRHVLHGGRDGYRLMMRLSRIIGPALAELVEAVGDGPGLDGDVEWDRLGAVISGAAERILDDERFVQDLMRHAFRDGKALRDDHQFDLAYQANYGELGAAVKRLVIDNFGDALKRLNVPLAGAAAQGSPKTQGGASRKPPKRRTSSG